MTEKDSRTQETVAKELPKGCPLSRRDAIAAAGGVAALFALGAAGAFAKGKPLVRPPGAADESEFLALCIKCDRCRSACPLNGIGVAQFTDGIASMRTPKMDFHRGWCNFCGKCAEACPTGALVPFDPETEKKRLGTAELTKKCIALRTGGCVECYKACGEYAITLNEDNVPVIDPELCTGCGICELVCPANVFQSYSGESERGIVVRPFAKEGGAS